MPIILMATVTRNSRPVVRAAFRRFFLFIVRFVKPYWDEASSEVIRRLMAPTASNKLRSEKVKGGSCMVYPQVFGSACAEYDKDRIVCCVQLNILEFHPQLLMFLTNHQPLRTQISQHKMLSHNALNLLETLRQIF